MGGTGLVAISGTEVFVEDSGGDGEPVVFLHGFLFDGRQFEDQALALRNDFRCITMDFPGQGRSARPQGGYTTERMTEYVHSLLRTLDLGPVHLVGLSMGGFSSMRIAAREPELVRSLTLLNTSAAPHSRLKFPKQLALAGVARIAGLAIPPVTSGIEDEMYGSAFRADPRKDPIRAQWRERWAAADRSALVNTLLGFMGRLDFRPYLSGITAPTMIIAGGADASLPPEHSRELNRLIPRSRLVELQGVGHSSPVENPDAVSRALRAFLQSAPLPRV